MLLVVVVVVDTRRRLEAHVEAGVRAAGHVVEAALAAVGVLRGHGDVHQHLALGSV